jgi:hypothetical protein
MQSIRQIDLIALKEAHNQLRKHKLIARIMQRMVWRLQKRLQRA